MSEQGVPLALVGHGKMGRMVESLAPEYGFRVAVIAEQDDALTPERLAGVGVAIEFTMPESAVTNIELLAAAGVHTVVGTTGWLDELPRARAAVERHGTGLVWGANFSTGVNVFLRVVAEAARLLADRPEYGAFAWEVHHAAKKDAPSGTLRQMLVAMQRAGYAQPIDVAANRAGHHPGTHEVTFDSLADTITLRHAARSREGFARGALQAAQWIRTRRGFYEFADMLFAPGGNS